MFSSLCAKDHSFVIIRYVSILLKIGITDEVEDTKQIGLLAATKLLCPLSL